MKKTMILNTGIRTTRQQKVTCHTPLAYALVLTKQSIRSCLRLAYQGRHFLRTGVAMSFVALALGATVVGAFSLMTKGIDEARHTHLAYEMSKDYDFVEVEVQAGETAWDLQFGLTPEAHHRDVMTYLYELNETDLNDLQPGDVLTLLTPKSK